MPPPCNVLYLPLRGTSGKGLPLFVVTGTTNPPSSQEQETPTVDDDDLPFGEGSEAGSAINEDEATDGEATATEVSEDEEDDDDAFEEVNEHLPPPVDNQMEVAQEPPATVPAAPEQEGTPMDTPAPDPL